ncbi:hypothetical protein PIB30_084037, partial [Stylosanthes scabra]|nr:hypothetical protein [Stylosanthes scabra]
MSSSEAMSNTLDRSMPSTENWAAISDQPSQPSEPPQPTQEPPQTQAQEPPSEMAGQMK